LVSAESSDEGAQVREVVSGDVCHPLLEVPAAELQHHLMCPAFCPPPYVAGVLSRPGTLGPIDKQHLRL
jgi:hypothetical protein